MSERGSTQLDWKTRALLRVGEAVLRVLAMTWRYRLRNAEVITRARAAGRPLVFSLWHGQLLPLLWLHRGQGIAILISEHKDGEVIARVAQSLGCRTIRGSTTRGGARALLELVRELQRGGEVAITPDGPRGPAEVFAPGAAAAVTKSGAVLAALAAHADRAWYLGSWDRFMIPKPFARITVAYSEPPTSEMGQDPRERVATFEALMHETTRAARA